MGALRAPVKSIAIPMHTNMKRSSQLHGYGLLALGLAAVLAVGVSAQQSNNVPAAAEAMAGGLTNSVLVGGAPTVTGGAPVLPFITATVTTNVVMQVQPLVLTSDQMSQVISNLEAIGISGNVPISAVNLQRVMVVRRADGSFLVTMQVH